ncbi:MULTISPECIES: hypothetical protein [Pseudomonas]|uniref:Uncharacterized protein n=1 Tax=Pseudomonas lutea TaxID=243924 RepID=A0A9X8MHS1_9PSED|nr:MULTISPECIES: hypothetical protein [Pseudomonas]SER49224.1 hypothetical protein SAMN05216409_12815 [Pseudomonas lutea]
MMKLAKQISIEVNGKTFKVSRFNLSREEAIALHQGLGRAVGLEPPKSQEIGVFKVETETEPAPFKGHGHKLTDNGRVLTEF